MLASYSLAALLMGVAATALIDLWSWLLARVFGVGSLNYCLLGRWLAYMPRGVFCHRDISARPARVAECHLGWLFHYGVGVVFAAIFLAAVPPTWREAPTLGWALLFGVATVLMPFCIMQPCLGLGFAAGKTARPGRARLKSLTTHLLFGLGLYLSAWLLRPIF